jgi:excisionase family DNA binding protein
VTLTITEAAARVKRSTRTIEQWISDGDLEVVEIRNMQGKVIRRYVEEGQLLTVLRSKTSSRR